MVFGRLFKKKGREGGDVIDLGKLNEIRQRQGLKSSAETSTTEQSSTDMGFLGTLASAAGSSDDQISSSSSMSSISSSSISRNIDPERFERLSRRIDRLIDKLELLERKIERIEHRVDLK